MAGILEHLRRLCLGRRSLRGLACAAGLLAAFAAEATVVVPPSDEALAAGADLTVVGTVAGRVAAPGFTTDYRVRVDRRLQGSARAAAGGEIVVRVPGGVRADGRGLRIFGAPRFTAGERVLLFLRARRDGTYAVSHLMLGAFHERLREGRRVAVRDLSEATSLGSPEAPRDFDELADWVARRAGKESGDAGAMAPSPPPVAVPQAVATLPFSFFEVDGMRLRWFEFDGGETVVWRPHVGGQPGLADGGTVALAAALDAWNGDPETPLALALAAATEASHGLDEALGPDGVNAILFDDPGGLFDEPFDCTSGGVVARGGVWFDLDHTAQFDGREYLVIEEADIVTNRGAGCYLALPVGTARNAEEIFAHEVGHTLGIAHACGDAASGSCDTVAKREALMRAYAHGDGRGARLGDDDLAALRTLYASLGGPPAAPQALHAGTVSFGELALRWEDGSANEEAFVVEELAGGAASEVARTAANQTAVTLTGLAPATFHVYQVRAVNALGASPPSNAAAATTLDPARCVETVLDGGFEEGTPSRRWDESSLHFGTPLCDESCDLAGTSQARSGEWWAWFGGTAEGESASLEQRVTIPRGTATLGFWVAQPVASGNGEDRLVATIDGEQVWAALEGDPALTAEYQLVQVDVSGFADGAAHDLRFDGSFTGQPGASSFFVDDVALASCTGRDVSPCLPDGETLCLQDGRFEVTAAWRRGELSGTASSVPWSQVSGALALSDPRVPEVLVKVLDGRRLNGRFWVFFGGTTDAELRLWVRDTATGVRRRLSRPAGSLCGDARFVAFADPVPLASPSAVRAPASDGVVTGGETVHCLADDRTLCLQDGRYQVRVSFRDRLGVAGEARAVSLADGAGAFTFFDPANLELLVSVTDGTAVNGRVWALHGPVTDLAYTVAITEVATGARRAYRHRAGNFCGAADFLAF